MIRLVSTITLFIILSISSVSQSLKSNLVGSWVKIKTTTLEGKDTCGNYGLSNDFLIISFTKKNIRFSRSPWDLGDQIAYRIYHDTIITPMHNISYVFQETYYYPEKIDSTDLILRTTFKDKIIRYYLKNQDSYKPHLIDGQFQFDNDTIVIERIPSTYPKNLIYTVPFSNASASDKFFTLRPIFNDKMYSFKEYINYNLRFAKKLEKDKFSKPIKVSFIIDYKGNVSQIHLIESFNEYYDKQILKLIEKTNRKWIPVIIDSPNHSVKATFTFLILEKSNHQ
jgi:hypothetical protein